MYHEKVLINKKLKHGILFELFQNRALYLMALPGIAFLLIFSYYPMLGIQIAFRDYNFQDGIWHSPFVGFKYFEIFFKSPFAGNLLFTTLYLNILFIVTGLIVSGTIAILLNEITNNLVRRVFQSSMFFTYFL